MLHKRRASGAPIDEEKDIASRSGARKGRFAQRIVTGSAIAALGKRWSTSMICIVIATARRESFDEGDGKRGGGAGKGPARVGRGVIVGK